MNTQKCPNCEQEFATEEKEGCFECPNCGVIIEVRLPKTNTRQDLIDHWMLLAKTIFAAEDNISDEWKPKLEASKNASKIVKEQMATAYLRAIATEIVEKGYEE